jgi:hypothetical protein
METAPLHLVIRFSDTMFEVGDVISLHNQIVDAHGAVWFGKLGGTLSRSRKQVYFLDQISFVVKAE